MPPAETLLLFPEEKPLIAYTRWRHKVGLGGCSSLQSLRSSPSPHQNWEISYGLPSVLCYPLARSGLGKLPKKVGKVWHQYYAVWF